MKTAKEFRDFFAAIPATFWATGDANKDKYGRCCAFGHLGCTSSVLSGDAARLAELFTDNADILDGEVSDYWAVAYINDFNRCGLGSNPRERILNALDRIIAKES